MKNIKSSKSIRELTKDTLAEQLVKTSKSIKTINLFPHNQEKLTNPHIQNYFESRINYLKCAYDYAYKLKVDEGISFKIDAENQKQLEAKYPVVKISSAEFDIITTKLAETISSIESNNYLTDITTLYICHKYNLDPKTKNIKSIIKPYLNNIKKSDLDISPKDLFDLFGYDSIVRANNLCNILTEFATQYDDYQLSNINSIINKITDFPKNTIEQFCKTHNKIVSKINNPDFKTNNNILTYFVSSLYFEFDPKLRDIENMIFPEVNTELNFLFQSLKEYFSTSTKFIQANFDIDQLIYDINSINYSDSSAKEKFFKILTEASSNKQKTEQVSLKKSADLKTNLFLTHPKAAPSFPSPKNNNTWNSQDCVSGLLTKHNNNYDLQELMSNYCIRLINLIQKHEANQIHRELTGDSINTLVLLNSYLGINKEESYTKNNDQLLKEKERVKVKTINGFNVYTFTSLSINPITTKDNLENYLNDKLSKIANDNIEFYILKDLNQVQKAQISEYIKEFLVSDIKNLTKKKESIKINFVDNQNNFYNILIKYLIKYEKHLLLDNSHENYQLTDKVAYRRYQSIADIAVRSINIDTKIKNEIKYNIKKLTLDNYSSITLKTSRMTKRTSGNSTLIFKTELKDNKLVVNSQAYCTMYAGKVNSTGQDIVVIEDYNTVMKKYSNKLDNFDICVGFLNGDTEIKNEIKINFVTDKAGNPVYKTDENGKEVQKSYQTYSNWTLVDGEVKCQDQHRDNKEPKKGTSPAGYPKLYYFVIPKNIEDCANLVIPVATNTYYLNKYTPYNKIKEYLSFAQNIKDKSDHTNIKKLLEYRCLLRKDNTISSAEIKLIEKIKKYNTEFKKEYFAECHLQYGKEEIINEEYDTNLEKFVNKNNYTQQELKAKFQTILAVDVGEKHIATISIRKINWNTNEIDNASYLLSYLPQLENNKSNNNNFDSLLNYDTNTILEHDIKQDQFFSHFNILNNRYKSKQRSNITVTNQLRNKKINLTDSAVESIATQITKLAAKHKSIVVFERLDVGFSSRKLGLSLMTNVQRLTYQKLTKVGQTLGGNNGMDIKYCSKDGKKGLALISPFMTSQQCSKCQYIPFINNNKEEYVQFDSSQWIDEGILEFSFEEKVFLQLRYLKDEKKFVCPINRKWLEKKNFLDSKKYFKRPSSTKAELLTFEEILSIILLTEKEKKLIKITENVKRALNKYLIFTRYAQDIFICANCDNCMNADYNATLNIGNRIQLNPVTPIENLLL